MRTHVDLFSGVGGFTLAAQWAGYETVLFVEKNEYCQKVLRRHWPSVPIIGDIRDVTEPIGIPVDLLTGGFPCQPFSTAGRRLGVDDDRYLWPEMLRVISLFKPTWVLAENVGGILTIDNGVVFECVLSDLEREGYEVQPFVIPACAVGAPHRRDRVWIVAHTDGFCWGDGSVEGTDRRPYRTQAGNGCEAVPDTDKSRLSRRRRLCQCSGQQPLGQGSGPITQRREPQSRLGRAPDGFPRRMDRSGWDGDWEKGTPRVAKNISHRKERLIALGNAIVPQVAYEIIKAMEGQDG